MEIKKGVYNVRGNFPAIDDGGNAVIVEFKKESGYIFRGDNGLFFGVCKYRHYWAVSELFSGAWVYSGDYNGTRKDAVEKAMVLFDSKWDAAKAKIQSINTSANPDIIERYYFD